MNEWQRMKTCKTLLKGAPGTGKSTYALQLAKEAISCGAKTILWVDTLESYSAVKQRAVRLGFSLHELEKIRLADALLHSGYYDLIVLDGVFSYDEISSLLEQHKQALICIENKPFKRRADERNFSRILRLSTNNDQLRTLEISTKKFFDMTIRGLKEKE